MENFSRSESPDKGLGGGEDNYRTCSGICLLFAKISAMEKAFIFQGGHDVRRKISLYYFLEPLKI